MLFESTSGKAGERCNMGWLPADSRHPDISVQCSTHTVQST